jgi:cytochrome c
VRSPRLPLLAALLVGLVGLGSATLAAPLAAHGRLHAAQTQPADSKVGAALYLDGVVASGQLLVGERKESEPLMGPQAACANCHRHSGLGSQEGRAVIPPITGQFLFHVQGGMREEVELPYVPGARPDRKPYSDDTLARAIREGVDSEGRTMSTLMPRYALNDADLAALIAHLRSLDRRRVPGVSDTELHFATIITPDADPVKRRGMLDVLDHFFEDRNNTQRFASSQNMMPSGNAFRVKGMFKVTRRWVLHVWAPTGPKSTWTAQLTQKFAAQPVFAVLSGLGGDDWTPVQAFCEQNAVPCLFPNVDLPPANAEQEFYSLYFSRGVRLEADLIGQGLMQSGVAPAVKEVRQVYRQGDIGEAAAAALAATLQSAGIPVSSHAIPGGAPAKAVAAAVHDVPTTAVLVLWLRPSDLASLAGTTPAGPVYLSGLMSDIDAKLLPTEWRRAHIAYPFDLPESRRVRVDYARGWFRIRGIPLVDEQLQADTYLACGLASETLKHMVDTFVPDYLIERLEDTAEHRIITGYYPRLTLGPHQRFASKGGFLVHLDAPGGSRPVPDGPWVTP